MKKHEVVYRNWYIGLDLSFLLWNGGGLGISQVRLTAAAIFRLVFRSV